MAVDTNAKGLANSKKPRIFVVGITDCNTGGEWRSDLYQRAISQLQTHSSRGIESIPWPASYISGLYCM
jgi:hypothetical protein